MPVVGQVPRNATPVSSALSAITFSPVYSQSIDGPPYNTEKCGWDDGDCVLNPVDEYPDCPVVYLLILGDGQCDECYNMEEFGWDDGDCVVNPVKGYSNCFVLNPSSIRNGLCDHWPPYNTDECGWDGGDCSPP